MAITVTSQLDMKALRLAIAEVLGLRNDLVREGFEAVDVVNEAFLSVNVMTSTQLGRRIFFDDVLHEEVVKTSCITVVSINAYGRGAMNLLFALVAAVDSSFFAQRLKSLNLAVVRLSPIRNLGTSVGAGFEERAQVDLRVSHDVVVVNQMGRAESVNVLLNKE